LHTYLLRYQAASFDDNVFDTQQLSGVRGASLSYLYSGELVGRILESRGLHGLKSIYSGASQGAFVFSAQTREVALEVRQAIEDALKQSDQETGCHNHLAYIVALVEGSDAKALWAAESLCNVKKLQQGSFVLPAYEQGAQRPGGRRDPRPAVPGGFSAAMKARQTFGRLQRQKFYQRVSCQKPAFDFTDELQEIVSNPPQDLPLSLHNKIAVFFADGDKFGERFKNAASRAPSLTGLSDLSRDLKKKQKGLFSDVLGWLGAHHHSAATNPYFFQGAARFETLLWGGDENLFVMPSWLGLEFAQLFYEKTGTWDLGADGKHWSFSSGLVICHYKTPIRQIKTVAKELAERNKGLGGGAIQIEIFESLSMPDIDFDSYRAKLYFGDKTPTPDELSELNRQLAIPGEKLGKLIDKVARLKQDDGLPRSQLHKMLLKSSKAGTTARSDEADRSLREDFALWKKRAGAATAVGEHDLDVFGDLRRWDEAINPKRPAFSLSIGLIALLWDYVQPLDPIPGGQDDGSAMREQTHA
jgi:hypothetical protein